MNSHNGRIAILFCGQIRTGIRCYPNIMRFLGTWRNIADIFVHTWDSDTIPPHGLLGRDQALMNQRFPVSNETFDKIKELYQPAEMVVEPLDDFYRQPVNYIPWLYSFIKVNGMRRRWEQEKYNGAKYMRVFKTRFDMLFPEHHTLNDEIKYMAGKPEHFYTCDIWNALPKKVEDIMWLSTPELMDVAEEWCWERLKTDNIIDRHLLDWQEHCKLFMDDRKIYVHSWQYNKLYHYRDLHEQMNIDINDLESIEELNYRRGQFKT
jgi:hypothetical protein